MDKDTTQRNKKIVKLHERGLTQQKIAEQLSLTRQRVQQIERDLGLKRDRTPSKGYELTCAYSGKKFYSRNKKQKFATRQYFYLSRRKQRTPEELELYLAKKRERNRKKAAWYYHHVFKKRNDWQDVVRQRNKKYAVPTTH